MPASLRRVHYGLGIEKSRNPFPASRLSDDAGLPGAWPPYSGRCGTRPPCAARPGRRLRLGPGKIPSACRPGNRAATSHALHRASWNTARAQNQRIWAHIHMYPGHLAVANIRSVHSRSEMLLALRDDDRWRGPRAISANVAGTPVAAVAIRRRLEKSVCVESGPHGGDDAGFQAVSHVALRAAGGHAGLRPDAVA